MSIPQNKSSVLILSRGVQKVPHLAAFLPEYDGWVSRYDAQVEAIAGWGYKPTADKARRLAKLNEAPYIALEDGFLRSIQLGRDGSPPLSQPPT